ncbi:ribbon-helix-helix protein, CopG family [Brevibacillus composti]|uniref:Ribbon-helix-helix protein, CopG family n=1 Tax=Brevibacillus composti TaxID=2796470 RepID=A0A7T5JN83_9BACL|nr:CopG family transcriptional regulator [Brevibacillus composti]QQE74173.1 ribbon-helix-helix protein, CopG family [Brevibacillus composti]QUO41256.1 ribbon-helix-helix protein, CopG family [Brevibacillus composti]
MFPRRKRNWDLSGVKERFRQEQSTHGINWGTDQRRVEHNSVECSDGWELETGWEEAEEANFEPADENVRQHSTISQSKLAFSERQNAKIADLCQHDHPYPSLERRPDFYEQHKKLTIYVEKDLLKTIERLKKGRYIPSYSWLVSEAIRFYLQDTSPR